MNAMTGRAEQLKDKEIESNRIYDKEQRTAASHDGARMEVDRSSASGSGSGSRAGGGVPSRALLLLCSDLSQC